MAMPVEQLPKESKDEPVKIENGMLKIKGNQVNQFDIGLFTLLGNIMFHSSKEYAKELGKIETESDTGYITHLEKTFIPTYFENHDDHDKKNREIKIWEKGQTILLINTYKFVKAQKQLLEDVGLVLSAGAGTGAVIGAGAGADTDPTYVLACAFMTYTLRSIGTTLTAITGVLTCVITNLLSLIMTMGASASGWFCMATCVATVLVIFKALTYTIKKTLYNNYYDLLVSQNPTKPLQIKALLNGIFKDLLSETPISDFDSLYTYGVKNTDTIMADQSATQIIPFMDQYVKDINTVNVSFSKDAVYIKEYDVNVRFHVVKDLFKMSEMMMLADMELLKQSKKHIIAARNAYYSNEGIYKRFEIKDVLSYFDGAFEYIKTLGLKPLTMLVWKYILLKETSTTNKSGGAFWNSNVNEDKNKRQALFDKIKNVDMYTIQITDNETKRKLLPVLMILTNDDIRSRIEEKANEFISEDTGNKRTFCGYQPIRVHSPADTKFNIDDPRHQIYVAICMRLIYNHSYIYKSVIDTVIDDNMKPSPDYLIALYILTRGTSLTKYPGQIANILKHMHIYNSSFVEEMKNIIKYFPNEKTRITDQCFNKKQQEDKIMNAIWNKVTKGGSGKHGGGAKHKPLSKRREEKIRAACANYNKEAFASHYNECLKLAPKIIKKTAGLDIDNMTCHDFICMDITKHKYKKKNTNINTKRQNQNKNK